MIKKAWPNILVILAISGFYHSAPAEDDILDILKTDTVEAVVQEKDDLADALKTLNVGKSPEQRIFLDFMHTGAMDKALFQWRSAFGATSFANTNNGVALHAYLLWQNGMPRLAIDQLLTKVKNPNAVHAQIAKMWRAAAPVDSKVWTELSAQMPSTEWNNFFSHQVTAKANSFSVTDPTKTEAIKSLIASTKAGTDERVWLEWQLALGLAIKGDTTTAARVLSHLLKSDQKIFSQDLIHMTIARLLFEKGYLSAAIDYYLKIDKESAYWFEAKEELAWSYLRKGEPQNALAVTKSLVIQDFAPFIGPEAVFVRSIAQLKVCDYEGVAQSIKIYRDQFRARMKSLLTLIDSPDSAQTQKFIQLAMNQGRVTREELGAAAMDLPRYMTRDESLFRAIDKYKSYQAEADVAGKLYSKSLSGASAEVGFQAPIEELKVNAGQRAQAVRSSVISRIKSLAQDEVAEIKTILNKMHIVEAELVQQLTVAGNSSITSKPAIASELKKGSTASASKYSMKFPYEGEIWFDEIDNYNVDIKKGCSALVR